MGAIRLLHTENQRRPAAMSRLPGDQGDLDFRVRVAAFGYLAELRQSFGTEMPRKFLVRGFEFDQFRVSLMGPQGIWKPAALPEMPLSITTVPPTDRKISPYDDELGTDGLLAYRYRGKDPFYRDNVGLRLALMRHVPLGVFLRYCGGLVRGDLARVRGG